MVALDELPRLWSDQGMDDLPTLSFEDVLPDAEEMVLGTKAVFGPMTARFLCFGQGNSEAAARGAATRPWAITIGTTKTYDPGDKGRVLNLVRMSSLFGPTSAYAANEAERTAFSQWPEAVALHDVYEFIDRPHVFDDLRLGQHPNVQAHDKVLRLKPESLPLLRALGRHRLRLRDLPPLPHFYDAGKLRRVMSMLPRRPGAEEGQAAYKQTKVFERSSAMARAAKTENHAANGGRCVCEGCDFSHESPTLFEAHHKRPLCIGRRRTVPADLTVLCPTCHTIVHRLAEAPFLPLDVPELRAWWVRHCTSAAELEAAGSSNVA